jgi:hypothetical protein
VAEERSTATALARVTATAEVNAAATAAVQATATARAEATAAAEAQLYAAREEALTWPVVITDGFDDNANGWAIGDVDNSFVVGTRTITNSLYRWEAEARQGVTWWSGPEMDAVGDCYLAVNGRVTGDERGARYGLIFRYVDPDNYYQFGIYRGYFRCAGVYDGEWIDFIDWTESDAIVSGGVNRLEVVAKGHQMTFHINGQYVAQHADDRLSTGRLALMVGLFEAGDTSVTVFDDFEFRAP